jgi:hypothetical protein
MRMDTGRKIVAQAARNKGPRTLAAAGFPLLHGHHALIAFGLN